MAEYISGIETGYTSRNTRMRSDSLNLHIKIFDKDREEDPIGLYYYLINQLSKDLRRELQIKTTEVEVTNQPETVEITVNEHTDTLEDGPLHD